MTATESKAWLKARSTNRRSKKSRQDAGATGDKARTRSRLVAKYCWDVPRGTWGTGRNACATGRTTVLQGNDVVICAKDRKWGYGVAWAQAPRHKTSGRRMRGSLRYWKAPKRIATERSRRTSN